jgi:hypothetical protein
MTQHHGCNRAEHELSRRTMLGAIGGVAAAGWCSPGGGLQPALAEALRAEQKQVLLIWLDGGISQLESWDPKPNTPFGGPFGTIPTSVPGVHVSELMPNTAKIMDKLAVVRSMCTKDQNHSTGVPRILRGDPKNRGVTYPYLGSAVTKLLDPPANGLPPYVWIKPGRGGFIYQHAGFLGAKYGALALGDGKPPIHVHRPEGIDEAKDAARNDLRVKLNSRFRARRRDAEIDAYEYSYAMASKLIERKDLFDEAGVSSQERDRYGTHPLGQHLLQARRLIEAGVMFVQVTSYHWDTHGDNFNMHLDLVPQIDRPFAALMQDLDERGLLENVVVVLMSEFGRTPKINQRMGRDHWPEAWSVAMAGRGIKRGVVVGQTSADGVWVDGQGYDVGHLFHTIFKAVGIDAKKTEYMNNGQPLPIAHDDCFPIDSVLV